ncbi:MAG: glycosyltransferase [Ilumatobacteraceae bacterium]
MDGTKGEKTSDATGGKVARRIAWLGSQLGHTRQVVRDHGWKLAVSERIGAVAAKSPQWRGQADRIEQLTIDRATVSSWISDLQIHERAHGEWLHNTNARHDELAGHLQRFQMWTDQRFSSDVPAQIAALRDGFLPAQIAALRDEWLHTQAQRDEHIRSLQRQVDELRAGAHSLQHIVTDWMWSANAPLPGRPSISVIMTTAFPERIDYLRSAIDSILHQSYSEWELIVIDDAIEPFLQPAPHWWPTDERIRVIRGEGMCEGRSRNSGLAVATGDVVAYLDDDCRWFPWWLHAVARAFSSEPDIGIVHGIRVTEADPGGSTWSYAQTLDPLALHVGNPADTNVMAHRRLLPDGDWPDISSCADYDTVIRLVGTGARYLPVPAATYAVSSPTRAWAPERASINAANFRVVQQRARAKRPMRVVAHNGMYPLLSETYIGDELEVLRRRDIDVVLSRSEPASVETPSRIDVPVFESLTEAISAHDPDLVLAHWAGVGLDVRPTCAELGVPYGIRLHSFDGGMTAAQLIDEWCAGIWNFPHRQRDHHLQFLLDTLIVDPGPFSDQARERSVLALSAGLPKRDWNTLVSAVGSLPDLGFQIVMATTNGHETLPAEVRGLIKQADVNGLVSENVAYEQGQTLLRSAGVLVYSLAPQQHVGQPRSVVESAIAGTPLVVPDCAAMEALVGSTAHRYECGDAASLARAIEAAVDHPFSIDERHALSRRVVDRHSGEKTFDDWANSLTGAVVSWQRRHRTDREGINLRWWWQT